MLFERVVASFRESKDRRAGIEYWCLVFAVWARAGHLDQLDGEFADERLATVPDVAAAIRSAFVSGTQDERLRLTRRARKIDRRALMLEKHSILVARLRDVDRLLGLEDDALFRSFDALTLATTNPSVERSGHDAHDFVPPNEYAAWRCRI